MSDYSKNVAPGGSSEPPAPPHQYNRQDPDQQELTSILRSWNLLKDPTSCIALGLDGVLRNLSGDRTVLDAVGLPPRLIMALEARVPPHLRDDGHTKLLDGTKTPKEQWFNPPEGLLPPPLSEEQMKEARELASRMGPLPNPYSTC